MRNGPDSWHAQFHGDMKVTWLSLWALRFWHQAQTPAPCVLLPAPQEQEQAPALVGCAKVPFPALPSPWERMRPSLKGLKGMPPTRQPQARPHSRAGEGGRLITAALHEKAADHWGRDPPPRAGGDLCIPGAGRGLQDMLLLNQCPSTSHHQLVSMQGPGPFPSCPGQERKQWLETIAKQMEIGSAEEPPSLGVFQWRLDPPGEG